MKTAWNAIAGLSKTTIAYNLREQKSSFGGSNQVAKQIVRHLRKCGYRFSNRLDRNTDCILMMDPRSGGAFSFGFREVAEFKRMRPEVPCIHRINECDKRKGTDFMDKMLRDANKVADFTIFVSDWLRAYHADRWFDLARPSTVILNGADPAIYSVRGKVLNRQGTRFRIVTHHWSDNWMKGFADYLKVDDAIATGRIPDAELWIVGRWPKNANWKAARLFPPTTGRKQASILRQCHVYITGTRWEPGGNHYTEGIQCGLPVVYHRDGGGACEVCEPCGVVFDDNPVEAIEELRGNYDEYLLKAAEMELSGDFMAARYRRLIDRVIYCAKNRVSRTGDADG